MKNAPPSRRDRLRQMLADLHMPGALEALDEHALEAITEAGHDLALLLHLVLPAEDTEVLVHRGGEVVADAGGSTRASAGLPGLPEPYETVLHGVLGVGPGG